MAAQRARKLYEQQGKERMQAGGKRGHEGGRGKKKTPVEDLPQGLREPPIRDQVGAIFGVSGKMVD